MGSKAWIRKDLLARLDKAECKEKALLDPEFMNRFDETVHYCFKLYKELVSSVSQENEEFLQGCFEKILTDEFSALISPFENIDSK